MKAIRKTALVVMTLSIAAAAGQVVQGKAGQGPVSVASAGQKTPAVQVRAEPGALPRLPVGGALPPVRRVALTSLVPAEGRRP
jgi:hypothetical protein